MSTTNVRLQEMLGYLHEGRFMDALQEFYADNVTMISPVEGTTTGLTPNIEREQRFFNTVATFEEFSVGAVAVTDTYGFYENSATWTDKDGQKHHVEQLVLQKWDNGKIVYERFYHQ